MRPLSPGVTLCACLAFLGGTSLARAQALAPPAHAVAASATPVAAAIPKAETPSLSQLFTSLGGDFKHLASRQNLFLASAGLAGSMTVHPWDGRLGGAKWGGQKVAAALAPGRLVGDFATQAGGAFTTYSWDARSIDRPSRRSAPNSSARS